MYKKLEKLLKQRKISTYRLAKDTGLQTAMFTNWKHGLYTPKIDKIQKIADYFGVPVTFFLE